MQSICTFCTCHLQAPRSAGPIPPPLFTVGDVVKQTAQRTCMPQHLPKTHLSCKRGIWGLHGVHCRKDEGTAEIPVVQTTSLEAYCSSEMENTNTRLCGTLLALPVTQAALSCLPRQVQAPLAQGEEGCSPPSTQAGAVVPEVYVAMVSSVVM